MNPKALLLLLLAFTGSGAIADSKNPLLEAARNADAVALRQALGNAKPAGVNESDERGFTPLMYAARFLSSTEMRLLIDAGSDVNYHNSDDVSAFNFCVADIEKAKLLLDRGFDIKKGRPGTASPLFVAARHPRGYEVAKLLIDKGADVNARGPQDATPLFFAIYSGNPRTVDLLMSHGADLNTQRKFDDGSIGFPLTDSLYALSTEVVKTLLKYHPDVNLSDGFAGHSLIIALLTGKTELVPALLDAGADIRAAKNIGEVPPVVMAAHNEKGSPDMVKLLLAKGADLSAHNDRDETAFTWARKRGETELVAFLRGQGAQTESVAAKPEIPHHPVKFSSESRETLVREAAARSIALLQKASNGFLDREGRPERCISCHHQTFPGIAFGWAAGLGIPVDQKQLARQTSEQIARWGERKARAWFLDDPVPGVMENLGYGLLSFRENNHAADEITDAMAYYLSTQQDPEGFWVSFTARPPAESTPIASTALVIRALDLYPPNESKETVQTRKDLAKKFLLRQKAFTSEERTYQVLGLTWLGALEEVRPFARDLLKMQRADGGWGQIPTLASDAYATGQILVALLASGSISVNGDEYRRAAEFLLSTQFPDGSWFVKSRSWPFQTHFSTGFPHGRDQWISAPATTWATLALMWSLDPSGPPVLRAHPEAAKPVALAR